jgi:hypothetical protein
MDIPRGWVLAALTAEAWLAFFVLLAFAGWLSALLA